MGAMYGEMSASDWRILVAFLAYLLMALAGALLLVIGLALLKFSAGRKKVVDHWIRPALILIGAPVTGWSLLVLLNQASAPILLTALGAGTVGGGWLGSMLGKQISNRLPASDLTRSESRPAPP
jgi:hypothetical protein